MIQDLEKCGLVKEDQRETEPRDLHDDVIHNLEMAIKNLNRGFKYSSKLNTEKALELLKELNHED